MPSSVAEMGSEINRLRMTVDLMAKEVLQKEKELVLMKADLDASNAHCTIMTRSATEAKEDLQQQKRKSRRSVKTSARYVTHPGIRAQWAADQEERAKQARETARKEAQKATEEAARNAQIQEDIRMRVFSGAFTMNSQ
jgi:hypothetical protein